MKYHEMQYSRSFEPIPSRSADIESVVLDTSLETTGYSAGGLQVGEACERCSRSWRAVGRLETVSLQHNCTNPQRVSEKPRDLARGGFSGRSPFSTGRMNVRSSRWWNGIRPVRTLNG